MTDRLEEIKLARVAALSVGQLHYGLITDEDVAWLISEVERLRKIVVLLWRKQ